MVWSPAIAVLKVSRYSGYIPSVPELSAWMVTSVGPMFWLRLAVKPWAWRAWRESWPSTNCSVSFLSPMVTVGFPAPGSGVVAVPVPVPVSVCPAATVAVVESATVRRARAVVVPDDEVDPQAAHASASATVRTTGNRRALSGKRIWARLEARFTIIIRADVGTGRGRRRTDARSDTGGPAGFGVGGQLELVVERRGRLLEPERGADQPIREPGVLGQQRAMEVGADDVAGAHALQAVAAV